MICRLFDVEQDLCVKKKQCFTSGCKLNASKQFDVVNLFHPESIFLVRY